MILVAIYLFRRQTTIFLLFNLFKFGNISQLYKMADAAAPAKAAPKAKYAGKPKKAAAAAHPKYSEIITLDGSTLKEICDSSIQAIVKHVMTYLHLGKDDKVNKSLLKLIINHAIWKRGLKQSKGECFVSICGVTTEAGGNGMGIVEFWRGTGYDFTLQCRQ